MNYQCNIRPRENDEDIPLGRVFKKQRLLVRKKDKKSDPTFKMTQCISSHNFCGGYGRNIGQKTFISTCYFQPKLVPVKYTETMILKTNSTKRRYYESVGYELKMVPAQWSQTMYVDVQPGKECFVSEVLIPCEIYVPLIPQEHPTETLSQVCNNEASSALNCTNDDKPEQHQASDSAETSAKNQRTSIQIAESRSNPRNATEEFLNEMRKMY